jgi:hypothetical protein
MNMRNLFFIKFYAGVILLAIALLINSCAKNAPGAPTPSGPLSFSARAGGYQRNFNVNSVTYTGNVLVMNLEYKGKPDTCTIVLVVTAKQYGNFTLASKASPNYAYMTIHDHLKDTIYYTDNTHLGNIQLTQLATGSGGNLVEGNFTFVCNETSPIAGGGVDTAKGSFTGITW